MALQFPTPTELGDDYLTVLKTLKPEVDTSRKDSDWWVRSRINGGMLSGAYADQAKVSEDIFPQSARREALEKHLFTYFDAGFNPAQPAQGFVSVTGVDGSTVTIGTEFTYLPNGNTYQATDDITLDGSTGLVPIQSVSTGQNQNLLDGAAFTISSPPPGINQAAEAEGDIADGRNEETSEEAAARVLSRIRQPIQGGTESDYKQWATDADPSVTSSSVVRFPFGLGTVAVYITAGTTDIDTALNNGDPIVRVPSQQLVDQVLEYIYGLKPITDCVDVFGCNEVEQDVTVRVAYIEGYSGTTVLEGQTLTLDELVEREVKRALYKVPIGGRLIGASGYIIAGEIEEVIDEALSASPYAVGALAEVIVDRQVQDLAVTGANRLLLPNEIVIPRTITVTTS